MGKVNTKEFHSTAVSCDTKAMNVNLYKKAGCDGDATAVPIKWGDCTKVQVEVDGKDVSTYYQITGAAALQATAALALAFVASQF